jgi:outer membrane immunogenic protein
MRWIAGGAAVAAGLLVSQAAWAADMPVKAPILKAPPAAAAANWTGFYLSGGFGYGFWTADETTSSVVPGFPEPPLTTAQRFGGRGWLARVGGGFDYQFSPHIIAGVFADFDWSELQGTIQDAPAPLSADIKQTSAWAAGVRVGWLVTPDVLSYVNGGFSSAGFSSGTMVFFPAATSLPPAGTNSGFVTPAFTTNGWFLGGGVEAALGRGWFWRNEYRYASYGNRTVADINVSSGNPNPALNNINFKPSVQTFTTQLAYKFNAGIRGATAVATPALHAANWSGAYVAAGLGYGSWSGDETTTAVPASLGEAPVAVPQRQGGKGWLGRIGGGYDQQFAPGLVAGAFADFDFSSLKGTVSDSAIPIAGDITQQWSWAVGVRAGYLITPAILDYVAGGYTQAHFSSATMTDPSATGAFFGTGTGTTPAFTRDGWFVGGGAEYALTAFANGLFVKTEYRYADYGSQNLSDIVAGATPFPGTQLNTINFKPVVQTVTSQLVYKFSTPR